MRKLSIGDSSRTWGGNRRQILLTEGLGGPSGYCLFQCVEGLIFPLTLSHPTSLLFSIFLLLCYDILYDSFDFYHDYEVIDTIAPYGLEIMYLTPGSELPTRYR